MVDGTDMPSTEMLMKLICSFCVPFSAYYTRSYQDLHSYMYKFVCWEAGIHGCYIRYISRVNMAVSLFVIDSMSTLNAGIRLLEGMLISLVNLTDFDILHDDTCYSSRAQLYE